jgi:large subunit ribosomal protein L18
MDHNKAKNRQRLRRRLHVRRNIVGTAERPRLSVFRSSKHIYAQLIDDLTGVTLAAASSVSPELRAQVPYGGNVKAATLVGKRLAEIAKEKGITRAAFDRGHYRYHGRVKALADGADAAGLKFRDPSRKPKKVKEQPAKPAGKAPKAVEEKTKPKKGSDDKARAPKEKGEAKAPKEKAPE